MRRYIKKSEQFTFLIVNLKHNTKTFMFVEDLKFTFLIVNLKPDLNMPLESVII